MSGITFNADEIFEMAEQIERNGARFYRKAATMASDDRMRTLLTDLAAMEDHHLEIFEKMRQELSAEARVPTAWDPDNQSAMYLQAMADKRVFDVDTDPSERLTGAEHPVLVLQMAIGLEKDSIVFYLGIRDNVPERLGRDRIDEIIEEEKRHITILSDEIRKIV